MHAAFALILAAEAATGCPRADARRLGGGAFFVRPVGVLEAAPFIWLGPATGIEPSMKVRRAGADDRNNDAARSAERCEPIIIQV